MSAPQFAKAESTIREHAGIIKTMETNIALLNDDELNAWFTQNQKYMLGYRMQVSQHASMLTADYDKEFSNAMNRAIEGLEFEGTLEVCEAQAIHAMMGAAPKCDGTSFSKTLATTMDADETLQTAIASINAVPWPTPQVVTDSMAIVEVTGSNGYINLHTFVEQMMSQRMQQHQRWLEQQNDSLIEGLETGDKEAFAKAEANRNLYLERLSADGDTLFVALQKYADKRGKRILSSLQLAFVETSRRWAAVKVKM